MYQSTEHFQWCFLPLVVFFPNFGYVFFPPHFQLLCEWTECNKRGFLEPWSTGYLCHSHIWSPGGTLSCSVISMFSFQRVSREFKIKHHFLLAMNRDTQSLSSAEIVYLKKKKLKLMILTIKLQEFPMQQTWCQVYHTPTTFSFIDIVITQGCNLWLFHPPGAFFFFVFWDPENIIT